MELKPQKLESKLGAHPLAINRRSAFIGRNHCLDPALCRTTKLVHGTCLWRDCFGDRSRFGSRAVPEAARASAAFTYS